ncbi:MAG: GNAT family N-acetyltransferase, partial [Clostridia bacterium]|nr:GNAT family N-acetyltransferase [Clostridia bacterium]
MVRRANATDIPELIRLLVQVNNVHAEGRPDLFRWNATKYDEDELQTLLADETKPVFVLPGENGILGYAFCAWEDHRADHNQVDR